MRMVCLGSRKWGSRGTSWGSLSLQLHPVDHLAPDAFANSTPPTNIGPAGKETLVTELDPQQGPKSSSPIINVERYQPMDQTTNCNDLFIISLEKRQWDPILDELSNHPIRTVEDKCRSISRGIIE